MIPPLLPPPLSPLEGFSPAGAGSAAPAAGNPGAAGGSFADELKGAIDQMQQLQGNASTQVSALIHGNSKDVHASMIAVEKADLAFGLMLQLRNKAVEAYQDISHMSF
ncbi:MAG: flagellar hook-basal body complex protein FliE [Terriglobales bacterium]